jgi:hypothetical protein
MWRRGKRKPTSEKNIGNVPRFGNTKRQILY